MRYYLAMYLYMTLMERKGWDKAPKFYELDEDEKTGWLTLAEIVMEMDVEVLREADMASKCIIGQCRCVKGDPCGCLCHLVDESEGTQDANDTGEKGKEDSE